MSTPRLLLLLVPLVLLAGLLLSLDALSQARVEPLSPREVQPPARGTIVGTITCLPHRDTSGPVTLECALGVLEESSGEHYSVDTRLMANMIWTELPTGARVRIDGVMTPIEYLSSDHWHKYDIVGIISATSIERL